jgi:hypothetical protein
LSNFLKLITYRLKAPPSRLLEALLAIAVFCNYALLSPQLADQRLAPRVPLSTTPPSNSVAKSYLGPGSRTQVASMSEIHLGYLGKLLLEKEEIARVSGAGIAHQSKPSFG